MDLSVVIVKAKARKLTEVDRSLQAKFAPAGPSPRGRRRSARAGSWRRQHGDAPALGPRPRSRWAPSCSASRLPPPLHVQLQEVGRPAPDPDDPTRAVTSLHSSRVEGHRLPTPSPCARSSRSGDPPYTTGIGGRQRPRRGTLFRFAVPLIIIIVVVVSTSAASVHCGECSKMRPSSVGAQPGTPDLSSHHEVWVS